MECPNCSFQNIPGTALCARCRSRLALEDVDFLPPRAGGGLALRKVWWRARSMSSRVEEWCATAADRARAALHPRVSWATLRWSIVPGLGHIRRGHRRTGLLLLAGWVLLLVLTAVNAGSGWAWVLYSAALAFHCFVVSLLLAAVLAEMTTGRRLRTGLTIYLVLVLVLYGPAILVRRGCVGVIPLQGVRSAPPVANGDVILYSGRWIRPGTWNRGDLVVYRLRPQSAGNIVARGGWGMDRIVGVPGDRLDGDGRMLLVNGEPVPQESMPMGGLVHVPDFHMVLDEGEFAVLPSLMAWGAQGGAAAGQLLVLTSRVQEEDLMGKVWWRVRPWIRFGPLE